MSLRPRRGAVLAALVLFHGLSVAQDEAYISLPDISEVRRLDLVNDVLEPWATGVFGPLYGEFAGDGFLYLQDSTIGGIWKIAPDGSKELLKAGGHIGIPLSVAVHPTTAEIYWTDALHKHIGILDPVTRDTRIYVDNSHGMFDIPGGLAFDADGTLYMTDHGTHNVMCITPDGVPSVFLDGPAINMEVPAGIELDSAGNLWVASFGSDYVMRIRKDNAEWEVFASGPTILQPNDVMLSPKGGLLVAAAESSSLNHIDALGRVTVLHQDASVGQWLGVAVPGTFPPCSGSITPYGDGTPGDGGFVPRLTGFFNPCPGVELGYRIDRAAGGAQGVLLFGIGEASLPTWGGEILVDLTSWFGLLGFQTTGVGPGNGEHTFRFLHPDEWRGIVYAPARLVSMRARPEALPIVAGMEMSVTAAARTHARPSRSTQPFRLKR